ncbi:hypothetical protein XELAEV_18017501mg [Xenopus laevis]|uniref:Uncharacterized protein n=1 Tax=Xenopus laevis TaxID=8355 RepID=A0A974DDA1_XENLA|nr:hypothetical protein XELAEV_18017501mg [Xenopus laevis]
MEQAYKLILRWYYTSPRISYQSSNTPLPAALWKEGHILSYVVDLQGGWGVLGNGIPYPLDCLQTLHRAQPPIILTGPAY